VGWLAYPLNNVLPLVVLAGTGVYCFPLARRLKNRPRALFLMFVGACLILIGLPFLLPVVSAAVSPVFWFFFKVSLLVYSMIWFRATWPRFRYDQLMNIGWRRLIPLGMGAVLVNAVVGMLKR
jgi:NADH-quinone oxidoreductase subunit H